MKRTGTYGWIAIGVMVALAIAMLASVITRNPWPTTTPWFSDANSIAAAVVLLVAAPLIALRHRSPGFERAAWALGYYSVAHLFMTAVSLRVNGSHLAFVLWPCALVIGYCLRHTFTRADSVAPERLAPIYGYEPPATPALSAR